MAVVPEAVIGIVIAACRVEYRLGGLVNGVIVKFG
jgi:hypothetical protein